MSSKTITVDVREDLRRGGDPFAKIMATVSAMGADEQLLLIAPFEPVPLFHVLARHGFQHATQQIEGVWQVLFTRVSQDGNSGSEKISTNDAGKNSTANVRATSPIAETIIDVDARRLEPPQPMVKILEALATLPEGAELRAHTDRRPIHLYPQLADRGFIGESQEQNDGSFITQIRRA